MRGFLQIKKILVKLWNKLVDYKIYLKKQYYLCIYRLENRIITPPKIKSIDETIDEIIRNKSSIARYGDGEFKLMIGKNISFQKYEDELSSKLRNILQSNDENFLVCLPDIFKTVENHVDESKNYWKLHLGQYRLKWRKLLFQSKTYYNSFISRCYYPFLDKSKSKGYFEKLKQIWQDRDIVIIEGRKSRLGIGNDLFDGVKSIERILVPEENAFDKYSEIFNESIKINKDKLILIAAGPTATVLSYDLYKEGYQVLDIGHVDIEYEWFLKKATKKEPVKNKYVCEAGAGRGVGDIDDINYKNQIIKEVI